MARIVVVTFLRQATPVAGQIAVHLVEVGHEVVVLTGPLFASTVTSARLFRALPPEATTDPTSKAWRGSVRGLRSAVEI